MNRKYARNREIQERMNGKIDNGEDSQKIAAAFYYKQPSKNIKSNGVEEQRYGNSKSTHPPSVLGPVFPFFYEFLRIKFQKVVTSH